MKRLSLLLALVLSAATQIPTDDTGIHENQLYVGNHEAISPITGNVSVQIPIAICELSRVDTVTVRQ